MDLEEDNMLEGLIDWEALDAAVDDHLMEEIKVHLLPLFATLKESLHNKIILAKEWLEASLKRVEACLDRTWEYLNSGHWKDVPMKYRYCYSISSVLKVMLLFVQTKVIASFEERAKIVKFCIEVLDKGLLLGGPIPYMPNLLTTIAYKLNNYYYKLTASSREIKAITIDDKNISGIIDTGFIPVMRYNEPSMETFYREIFMPKVPAVMEGCIKHWRAMEMWKDSKYLMRVAGARTVPVEIGSRYTEEDWSQSLIPLSQFLEKYILSESSVTGYLAQHQLFEQIPELKDDFTIPYYCNFSDKNNEEFSPDINVWFGPANTVSPLHYDPKCNLLCQVVGYKKIILYSPHDSINLYPYDSRMLNNTAQVDPGNPNYEKWPNFQRARGMMCYLRPGDTLFIPRGWWHYVVSLSTSFSVSFWWD